MYILYNLNQCKSEVKSKKKATKIKRKRKKEEKKYYDENV